MFRLPVLRDHLLGRLSAPDIAKSQCKGPVDVGALSKPGVDIEHAFSVLLRPLLLQPISPMMPPPLYPVRPLAGLAPSATKEASSLLETGGPNKTVVIIIDGLDEAEDEEALDAPDDQALAYAAGPLAARGNGIFRLLTSFLTRLPSKTFRFFLTARPWSRIQVLNFLSVPPNQPPFLWSVQLNDPHPCGVHG